MDARVYVGIQVEAQMLLMEHGVDNEVSVSYERQLLEVQRRENYEQRQQLDILSESNRQLTQEVASLLELFLFPVNSGQPSPPPSPQKKKEKESFSALPSSLCLHNWPTKPTEPLFSYSSPHRRKSPSLLRVWKLKFLLPSSPQLESKSFHSVLMLRVQLQRTLTRNRHPQQRLLAMFYFFIKQLVFLYKYQKLGSIICLIACRSTSKAKLPMNRPNSALASSKISGQYKVDSGNNYHALEVLIPLSKYFVTYYSL